MSSAAETKTQQLNLNRNISLPELEKRIKKSVYSFSAIQLRKKLLWALQALQQKKAGLSNRQIASGLMVSESWVRGVDQQYIEQELAELEARNEKKPLAITVRIQDNHKNWTNWTFGEQEIQEANNMMEKGQSAKEIAIGCCCSAEAAKKLIEIIEEKGIGGDNDGREIFRTTSHRKHRTHRVKRSR